MCGVGDDFWIAGVGKRIADPEDRHGHRRNRGLRSRARLGEEFAFDDEDGPDAYNGTISLSSGSGGGPNMSGATKAKSNPTVNTSFEGLNFYQQRYSRGGNQFSIEPPDQGLCVGNGFELEVINDVVNIYNRQGSRSYRTTPPRTSSAGSRATSTMRST